MALNPKKLGVRAMTFVIAGGLLFLLVMYPPKWVFHVFLALAGLVGVREFHRIAVGLDESIYRTPVIFSIIYGIAAIYIEQLNLEWLAYFAVLITALLSIFMETDVKHKQLQFGLTLVAIAYIGFSVISVSWLFQLEGVDNPDLGRYCFLLFLLTVWGGDSFAYLGGSMFGKHKIAPVLSPNKSWEGMFSNLLGNATVLTLAQQTMFPEITWPHILCLTFVFGLLGFFGDLVESSWKRGSEIKDSSTLFPGHGGILDRIDSIFLTAPVFYFYIKHVLGLAV